MEQHCPTLPTFNKKYTTVIATTNTYDFFKMVDWVNINSKNSVDVKSITDEQENLIYYFAFENDDDALIFKIKYSL